MAQTAAERKRAQRERLEQAVYETPDTEWSEAVCLHVLQSAHWKDGAIGRAAWQQLGRLRGYDDRQQPLL